MVIIEDTRNQIGKHENINEQIRELGHSVMRSKLLVGDYSYAANQAVCIDTKAGLQEVAGNIVQSHERFRRELQRAEDAGIKLVVLVEEDGIESLDDVSSWHNPRLARWMRIKKAKEQGKAQRAKIPARPPINGERLEKSMRTMAVKYGVRWEFCSKSETGQRIIEILEAGRV